ncbi:MAG: hypothetical protein AB1489_35485 [Acidobacteriota bacterium]
MKGQSRHNRRQFLRQVVAAPLLPAVLAQPAINAIAASPTDTIIPLQQGQDNPPPGSEELMKIIKLRYGKHIDSSLESEIRSDVESYLRIGATLRAIKLANSVEPDVIFRAIAPKVD